MKTRLVKDDEEAEPSGEDTQTTANVSLYQTKPPEIWIMPENSSSQPQLIQLIHPHTGKPHDFILVPDSTGGAKDITICEYRRFYTDSPSSFLVHSELAPQRYDLASIQSEEPVGNHDENRLQIPELIPLPSVEGLDPQFVKEHTGDKFSVCPQNNAERDELRSAFMSKMSQLSKLMKRYEPKSKEHAWCAAQWQRLNEQWRYTQNWFDQANNDLPISEAQTQPSSAQPVEETAFVTKQDLYVITPVDIVYLLLPLLCPAPADRTEGKPLFVPFDDLVDSWKEFAKEASYLFDAEMYDGDVERVKLLTAQVQEALGRVCDTMEIDGQMLYRFSADKLRDILVKKADAAASLMWKTEGLPPSLEQRVGQLVKRLGAIPSFGGDALEEMGEASDADSQERSTQPTARSGHERDASEGNSQSTEASLGESVFSQPAAPVSKPQLGLPQTLVQALRKRAALDFILASYVPPHVSKVILKRVDEDKDTNMDILALKTHMAELKKHEAMLTAAQNISGFGRSKRALEEDIEEQAAKKRKQEEEERKKKSVSHGVKQLAKADTSGMKKLSAFFTARPKKEAT